MGNAVGHLSGDAPIGGELSTSNHEISRLILGDHMFPRRLRSRAGFVVSEGSESGKTGNGVESVDVEEATDMFEQVVDVLGGSNRPGGRVFVSRIGSTNKGMAGPRD